jgi:hypothetical protein
MKWLKRLNNPFVIMIEGFVAGAVLLVVANPGLVHRDDVAQSRQAAALEQSLIR